MPSGAGVRDDGGVTENSEVTIYYDPMISKLAVWGKTRAEAIDRMRRALDEYTVGGIKTTLPFFREIIRDAEFVEGNLDTGFIQKWQDRKATQIIDEISDTAQTEQLHSDVAIIAAALDYQNQIANGATNVRSNEQGAASRWKMFGRAALHRSRI